MEVLLVLEVTVGTAADDPPEEKDAAGLSVYPNPFARRATLVVTLGTAADVRVAVYDVLGRKVAVLTEGPLPAGEHTLRFDGARLPAGVYLMRVEGLQLRLSQRVTLLK